MWADDGIDESERNTNYEVIDSGSTALYVYVEGFRGY